MFSVVRGSLEYSLICKKGETTGVSRLINQFNIKDKNIIKLRNRSTNPMGTLPIWFRFGVHVAGIAGTCWW